VLFFILGAYIYYTVIATQTTKIIIKNTYLLIGEKTLPRHNLVGYVIEIEPKTQKTKNLVLVGKK
jgi:hypothetical protein